MTRTAYAQPFRTIITTTVVPPVSPFIESTLSQSNKVNVMITNISKNYDTISVIGAIQRLSPSAYTIAAKDASYPPQIVLIPMGSFTLTVKELSGAFDGFHLGSLSITGISPGNVIDSSTETIKLPPGQYRICFTAMKPGPLKNYVPDSGPGCAFFNICNSTIAPPQFTRPTSSFSVGSDITVIQDMSPVNFTWTPPLSTCGSPGAITYELEIREIFNNQNVTDALNNPLVFSKMGIPSPAFLLDMRVYPNVLQPGRRYVARVRAAAVSPNSVVTIDNNGYSRPEAFQFGSENALTSKTGLGTLAYYLPLEERKSNFWSDYERKDGKDTLIPVAEYVAYKLMQEGVAYSQDAIDLLVAANPVLKDARTVSLKEPAQLPGFPEITDHDRRLFDALYAADMQPNSDETIRFRRYLDSLKISSYQKLPDRASSEIMSLIGDLDRWKDNAATANGVSLGFMNASLSELLFVIRNFSANLSNNAYNHLHDIISDVKTLTTAGSSGNYVSLASFKGYVPNSYLTLEPLIPVDVIVYRPVLPPGQAILNAPDLKGVYRIFYTSRTLYNNKNPEINAKSPGPLASTTQVSLPGYLKYKFWTLDMIHHKQTLAQDIDLVEIARNNQKEGVKGKKITIVLKVE